MRRGILAWRIKRWIRRNIAAFEKNPNSVTISGCSFVWACGCTWFTYIEESVPQNIVISGSFLNAEPYDPANRSHQETSETFTLCRQLWRYAGLSEIKTRCQLYRHERFFNSILTLCTRWLSSWIEYLLMFDFFKISFHDF